MRIPTVELEGYEADDLLATLTQHAPEEGDEVVIVTGDRDILQLVRDGVVGHHDPARNFRCDPLRRVRPSWSATASRRRNGSTSSRSKARASDNLPGVPGVGDKTAAQLINKYGDIEQVIAHADELTPKLRDAVKVHADQVRINKELGRLLDDVPLDLDPAQTSPRAVG